MAVEVGDQAPDFELNDQHGTPVRLSSFRGAKNVVLVFYPLAFSGVCTGELCAIRDEFPEVNRDDVEMLTVSVDSTFAHRAWADAEHFEFGLLSDFWPHGEVAKRTVCSTPSAASRPGARSSSTRTASCGGRSLTRSRRRATSPSTQRRSPRSASASSTGRPWGVPCYRCGVRQTDPERGKSPWRRGVLRDQLVLVCPACQESGDWTAELDPAPGAAACT